MARGQHRTARASRYRRRGIGTRAHQLLCDYLFETTSVNRVEAVTNAGNTAEQHALTAAGFTYEGTIRQAEFLFGRWHDLLMFSRLRSEWVPPPLPPGHAAAAVEGRATRGDA